MVLFPLRPVKCGLTVSHSRGGLCALWRSVGFIPLFRLSLWASRSISRCIAMPSGFYTVLPSVAVRGGCGFDCSADVAIICLGNIITQCLNNSKCKITLFFKHFQIPQSLYYRAFSTFSHSQKTPNLQIIGSDQIKGGGGTFFPVPPSQNPHHHVTSPLASLFDLVPRKPRSTHRSFSTFTAGTIWKV